MSKEKINDGYQNYCEKLANSYFLLEEKKEKADILVINLVIDLVITLFFCNVLRQL